MYRVNDDQRLAVGLDGTNQQCHDTTQGVLRFQTSSSVAVETFHTRTVAYAEGLVAVLSADVVRV